MIANFSVSNFISIKDKIDLNLFSLDEKSILKTAMILGSNGVGKSNLVKAINFLKNMTEFNSPNQGNVHLRRECFKFDPECKEQTSQFEIFGEEKGFKFIYGIEVDDYKVHSEWLYESFEREPENLIYHRENSLIFRGKYLQDFDFEGCGLKSNITLLSILRKYKEDDVCDVLTFFDKLLIVTESKRNPLFFGESEFWDEFLTNKLAHDLVFKEFFLKNLNNLGFDVKDFINDKGLKTIYEYTDKEGNKLSHSLDYETQESSGLKKTLEILLSLYITKNKRSVLIFENLESCLHPCLFPFILGKFEDNEEYGEGCQIIFTTRNDRFLDSFNLRNEQVYFMDKKEDQSSDLFSLIEYKTEHKDIDSEDVIKNYRAGRYTSLPFRK